MKSIIKITKYIMLSMLFLVASCESFLGDRINEDPNKPVTVPVNAMLPAIEIVIADVTGGSFSRFNSMLTQQVEGVARQWSSFNNYSGLTPNRFDAAWSNLYESVLIELNIMIAQSNERGYNHYAGIGQVLKAYSLMIMTDVWGDIPYTESAQGLDLLNPKFDDQATIIYPEIYSLLNSALANFALDNGGLAPGVDDVIYGGSIDKWIKAARAVRARANLNQGNYADALADAQNSLTSRSDNFRFTYTSTKEGQWYRFNRDRTGDIEFNPFMANLMTTLGDNDRKAIFEQTFNTDHPYLVAAFGQDLVPFREIKFIEAECLLRTGGSATDINDAYLAGILASFEEVGLSVTEYNSYIASATVNPGAASLALNDILTQKYIGLFVQQQVFNDYRRTGFPNITPTSGTEVPVRWNYSSDELLFNSNAPSQTEANLFTPRVDWNQ